MDENEENEDSWLHEAMERGKQVTSDHEKNRAKQAKTAQIAELIIFALLVAVLLLSAIFWR